MLFSVILALSREGKVSRQNFHLERSLAAKAETDLIWQLLQGKVPQSADLSYLMEPGTQPKRSCLLRLSK